MQRREQSALLPPSERRFWRMEIVAAVEILGVAVIAFGVGLIFVPAGIIAAGLGLVLFALAAQMGGGNAR